MLYDSLLLIILIAVIRFCYKFWVFVNYIPVCHKDEKIISINFWNIFEQCYGFLLIKRSKRCEIAFF